MKKSTSSILRDIANHISRYQDTSQKLKIQISFKYADYESVISQLKLYIQQATSDDKEKFEKALTHAQELKDAYMWAHDKIFN